MAWMLSGLLLLLVIVKRRFIRSVLIGLLRDNLVERSGYPLAIPLIGWFGLVKDRVRSGEGIGGNCGRLNRTVVD